MRKTVHTVASVLLLALVPPALAGCSGGAPDDGSPTYYRDVKVLLDSRCTRCHSDGGVAPFSLTSYDQAYTNRNMIEVMVSERLMPPWLASPDCNSYEGDFSLTDGEIDAIVDWVEAGAPEGDPADEPPPRDVDLIRLSRVDLDLSMPEVYVPTVSPDDHRCFVLDWPEQATTFVTGFGVVPGVPEIVHHLVADAIPPERAAEVAALDAADPGPGYYCLGGVMVEDTRNVGLWVPGNDGSDYPAGTGLRVEPGSKIVVQIHYNTANHPPVADMTTLQFRLETDVAAEAFVIGWTNLEWFIGDNMLIPAGEPDVGYGFQANLSELLGVPVALDIYAARLHMHWLGDRGRFMKVRPDGSSECIVDVPHWDFHWQNNYTLATPTPLEVDDDLYVECHFDNTAANQPEVDGMPRPVQDVVAGAGSLDEMCIGIFYATVRL